MVKIINPKDDRSNRVDKIFDFIKDRQFYCAVAYAKVCKFREDEYNKVNNTNDDYFNKLYTSFAYAFDDPWYFDRANGFQYTNSMFGYINNIDDINEEVLSEDRIFKTDKFKNFILLVVAIRILYSSVEWYYDFDEKKEDNKSDREKIENICDDLSVSFIKEDVIDVLFSFIDKANTNLKEYSNKEKQKEIENIKDIKENRDKNKNKIKELISKIGDTELEDAIRKDILRENGRIGKPLTKILYGNDIDIREVLKDFLKKSSKIEIDNNFDIKEYLDYDYIEKYINDTYKNALRLFPKFKNKDNSSIIENIEKDLYEAIDLLAFFALKKGEDLTDSDKSYLEVYDEILDHLKKAVGKLDEMYDKICIQTNDDYDDFYKSGLSILKYTVNEIEDSFSREKEQEENKYEYGNNFYVPFLLTNDVVLDENFFPDFPTFYENEQKIENYYAESFNPEFTPEYLISNHVNNIEKDIKKELEKIDDIVNIEEKRNKELEKKYNVFNIREELKKKYKDDRTDNYGILSSIAKYLSLNDYKNDNNSTIYSGDKERARLQREDKRQDILGELELSHCYRQFDDVELLEDNKNNECESQSFDIYLNIQSNIDKWYKWLCIDNSNYGIFEEILNKYTTAIKNNADKLEVYWQDKLDSLKLDCNLKHIEKIGSFIEAHNFSATIEVFDILSDSKKVDEYFEKIELNTFLSNFTNNQNYNICFNEVELSDGDDLLQDCVEIEDISDDNEFEANKLAENWDNIFSSDKNKLNNDFKQILKTFLEQLGFKVKLITNENDIKFERGSYNQTFYNHVVTLCPIKRGNLNHTISSFGTKASEEGFRIIVVQGKKVKYEPKNYLVDLIKQIGMDRHTIILLNRRLSLDERRSLAKLIKQQCNNKLFLVVDRVVMAFLMKNYNINTINEMFMSIVTPFGFYQPYISKASDNNIPEEMFIGRDKELEAIEKIDGPSIVYGGRQLGKSALLRQAEKDINSRSNDSIAVYVDIKGRDYIRALEKITEQMKENNVLDKNVNITNWKEFKLVIENLFKSKDISYFLLLIDEADKFFESCNYRESDKDEPFLIIKDIKGDYPNKFKVVFAGLNMIMEYDFLTNENSIAAHFKDDPVSVGPFSPKDARELIEKPLHYLGLDFSTETEIYLILENTNYYPCLIQLYCEKLLKLMTEDEYAGYSEKDSPIYNVRKEHIRKILSDRNFTDTVWNKFELTLKLDKDDYYYYLSLMLALMCHNKYDFYAKDDFRRFANSNDIEKISELKDTELDSLLEQLVALEVFRKDHENKYGFRRFRLFQLMGSKGKINDRLCELMEKYSSSIDKIKNK